MNQIIIDLIIYTVKVIVVFTGIMLLAAYCTLGERRLSAFMQDRLGPNRAGPQGLFQPFADFIKLIVKEDYIPDKVDRFVFRLAPALILFPALIAFAVIPFGDEIEIMGREIKLQIADLDFGIIYVLAVSSLMVYGIVLGAWASNNKYSLFGGIRSSAQMISYEISLGLSLIGILMLTGSLKLDIVVYEQADYWLGIIPKWNIIRQPVAFFVFLIAAFAETNRLPFDIPEAEQELVGGYHTEYSSLRFSSFYLSEYIALITSSALISTLFFGGWHLPWIENIPMPDWLLQILQVCSFGMKTLFCIFCYIWVRWTLPRFRFDQLMKIGWKFLLPLALANIIVTGIIMAY